MSTRRKKTWQRAKGLFKNARELPTKLYIMCANDEDAPYDGPTQNRMIAKANADEDHYVKKWHRWHYKDHVSIKRHPVFKRKKVRR